MGDPVALFRETPSINKEPTVPLSVSSSSSLTPTATITTVSKHRRVRRVIKKHLQQKYLLCGFAIHAFLASPAYLYGIIVDNNIGLVIRIWPAILYQAVGQICQSFLLYSAEKCQGKTHSQWENRKAFLFATLIICTAIIVCGFLFSSAWITVTATTQLIAVIIYGLFGGIGSSLIYARTHRILESVRPKEDKYVRKTIHLCGEAFCQLFLCFVFTSLRALYGISQTLTLMAALLINLIPLGLLITRKYDENLSRIHLLTRPPESAFQGLSRLGTTSNIDQLDGIELQQTTWKNPRNPIEVCYNYMALNIEEPSTIFVNANGVEIMDIIPEEDETVSAIRSSSVTIDRQSRISCEQYNGNAVYDKNITNLEKIQEFSKNLTNQMMDSMTDNIVIPLQRAMVIMKLYPATFLQSADIFSYVMCLTVLPGLAVRQHALKFAEIPFLFSLLAFPWMCFALMTPRFGHSLVREKGKWHAFGCISKTLALFFISISASKLLLSLAAVLLGFGQAVSLFLQDLIIQNSVPKAQWIDVKYPLYSTNGILILVWGVGAHLVIKSFGFQASVAFSAFVYFLSIITWYIFPANFLLKKGNNSTRKP